MRAVMTHSRRWSDRVLSLLVVVAMGALLVDVLWGVVSRDLLAGQSRWTDELAIALLIWVSMLGAALVYGEGGHLGVDYFVGKLDPSAERFVQCFVHILVMLFAALVMVYGGYILTKGAFDTGQMLPALGWRKGYTYLAVPISGIFLLFYSLEGVIGALSRAPDSDRSPER